MNWKRLRTPTLITIAIVATAGISGAVGASAAVHYLVLGARNSTTATTTLTDTTGTPLSLVAKSGTPPLAVNSNKAVSRLNSDYVDGYHASSFAKVTGKTGVIVALNTYATCPTGTVLTGGGGYGLTGSLFYSGPFPTDFDGAGNPTGFVPNTWWAIDTGDGDYYSYAYCYKPNGAAIPGAGKIPAAALAAAAPSKLQALMKAKADAASRPAASPAPVASPTRPAPSPIPSPR